MTVSDESRVVFSPSSILGAALAVALAMVMAVANRQRPPLRFREWRATVFPVNMLLSFCCCFFRVGEMAAPYAGTLLASAARSSFFATLLDGLSGKASKKRTWRGTL
ncbi:hypothetical protein D3C76_644760 [compost metagenome]